MRDPTGHVVLSWMRRSSESGAQSFSSSGGLRVLTPIGHCSRNICQEVEFAIRIAKLIGLDANRIQ
jgi:hypothetical protein